MESLVEKIALIEKEDIKELHFPSSEVLASVEMKKKRDADVAMGMRLGNNHRGKVKIIFEDDKGLKAVETTIWVGTEKSITLKGGAFIPIHRIHEIRIY